MQLVVSALRDVGKRIIEMTDTHKLLLQMDFSSCARKCAIGCISVPAPYKTIATERLYPTRSLLGRYSTMNRFQKKMSEENFYSNSFEFSIINRLKILINRYCLYRILSISLYPKIELMIKISHSRIKAIIKVAYCLKKTVRFFYEQN